MDPGLTCGNADCRSSDVRVLQKREQTTVSGSLVIVYTYACRACKWTTRADRYVGPASRADENTGAPE